MTPLALVLALVVAVDPCAEAPPPCRQATRDAILTWRTTAQLREAALVACEVQLEARSSTSTIALAEASAQQAPEPSPVPILLATGAVGVALGLVLGVLIARR